MPSYHYSSSVFLQSHYAVLPSSFLLPFSCTTWCCCSLPCISKILLVQIFSFSVLSFCCTDQEFLQEPRSFSSANVCQDLMAVSFTTVLKVVIMESMSVSSLFMMVRGANFPSIIAWKVSNTLEPISLLRLNLSHVCFGLLIFFSGEGGRSSSASYGHFQCLLQKNFMFWHCSLLIRSASTLECNH